MAVGVFESLQQTGYFYRHHVWQLALYLAPVLLPIMVFLQARIDVVLHNNPDLAQKDPVVLVISLILGVIPNAITLIYAVRVVNGEGLSLRSVYRDAFMAAPKLALLYVLTAFATLGGMTLLILPGLWLLACLLPAGVLVAVEGQGVIQAMMASVTRFQPLAWQILLAMALAFPCWFLIALVCAQLSVPLDQPSIAAPVRWLVEGLLQFAAGLAGQYLQLLIVRFYDSRREMAL